MPSYVAGAAISVPYAYTLLPKQWDRLRNTIRNVYKARWQYFCVVEGQTQRGNMPHFHVISNLPTPKYFTWRIGKRGKPLVSDIRDVAVHCGFGVQAHEKFIDTTRSEEIVRYATKLGRYLTKEQIDFDPPKYFRRLRASQKWPKLPPGEQKMLIMRGKEEALPEYVLRVSMQTGLSLRLIWQRYREGIERCES